MNLLDRADGRPTTRLRAIRDRDMDTAGYAGRTLAARDADQLSARHRNSVTRHDARPAPKRFTPT